MPLLGWSQKGAAGHWFLLLFYPPNLQWRFSWVEPNQRLAGPGFWKTEFSDFVNPAPRGWPRKAKTRLSNTVSGAPLWASLASVVKQG